jgi:HAD superfamily hydrolase (TIGR01457 family)
MSDAGNAMMLRAMRGFIFDADGTLYRGETVLPGAAEFIADLSRLGIPWLVATNNSTTPVTGVAARLTRMGIPATVDEVLNSSQVAAAYVAGEMPGARVFMVGEAGVREALLAAGVPLTEDWQAADAVVVGLDREATYARLRDAALAIRRGAQFIATNPDRTLPTEQGLIPGAGSVIAFLEIATDVQAHVTGKPSPDMFRHALARLGTPASLTAAVGDRPETDIAGGQAAGLRTIGVLTGASPAEAFAATVTPADWVYADLVGLRRVYLGLA